MNIQIIQYIMWFLGGQLKDLEIFAEKKSIFFMCSNLWNPKKCQNLGFSMKKQDKNRIKLDLFPSGKHTLSYFRSVGKALDYQRKVVGSMQAKHTDQCVPWINYKLLWIIKCIKGKNGGRKNKWFTQNHQQHKYNRLQLSFDNKTKIVSSKPFESL